LRRLWRSSRGPLLLAVLVLAVLIGSAVFTAAREARPLDPRDASPQGARAVAELLRARGVPVEASADVDAALAGADSRTVVVVPLPGALPRAALSRLASAPTGLVLVAPGDDDLRALRLPVERVGLTQVGRRLPACDLPAARTAGDADLGGALYRVTGDVSAVGCYPAGGDPSLVSLTWSGRAVTILGSPEPLLNERLAHRGNAALALSLLSTGDRVRWVLPTLPTAAPAPGERKGLFSLLPSRVRWALLELLIAVGLLALWRARRLGAVVDEPLPVVVRAAEAVEGRARLYRASGARRRAADELRAATRARLTTALGLPPEPSREALAAAVEARVARPAPEVAALLYGAAADDPADDAALVRLAGALDTLETRVRHS
jgi:hypothetical protein